MDRLELTPIDLRGAEKIKGDVAAFARQPNGGLFVTTSARATAQRELIIALAAQHRLPAMYPYRYWASGGGLLSYGPDPTDNYRRAADYIDPILRGEDLSRFLATAEPDAVHGQQLFSERCAACHALDANKTGPMLGAIFGRKSGSVPGYTYSPALAEAGISWSADNLDRASRKPSLPTDRRRPGSKAGMNATSVAESRIYATGGVL
jgi:cytochrome c2